MSFVVAISGTSGAGKSTLISDLAARFSSVALIQFDHYIILGTDSGDLQSWVDEGADPNEIVTPQLETDLAALRSGQSVSPPGVEQVQPAPLILLEEPFGRQRSAIASYIDLSVHLELPADVALARSTLRTIRSATESSSLDHHANTLANLGAQLASYLGPGREAYRLADLHAKKGADLVFDAQRPVDELVHEILDLLAQNNGPAPE